MALSGTLSDLDVVDLVQFPATANKTGELFISGPEKEARLYYVNGRLTHVRCGEASGLEAMIALVDWHEGAFEFQQGITTTEESVTVPTTALVAQAINAATERQLKRSENRSASPEDLLQRIIEDTAMKLDYVAHVLLYSSEGKMLYRWHRDSEDPELLKLIDEVRMLFDNHPREGLSRIYLSDTVGTCIASVINDSIILFLSADELASLGMVSLASNRMSVALLDALNG
jgi:hypothetical protein